jgi:outer membrane immunogenic protein
MNIIGNLLGAAAAVVLVSTASAADLSYKAPPPEPVPAPIYNWTGFYIGGHLGAGFTTSSFFDSTNGRFLGGVQGGADYQFGNWVLGIEGQYTWTDQGTNSVVIFPSGITVSDRNSNLGSVTGRLGLTWGAALLYAKGGVGFRDGNDAFVRSRLTGLPVAFASSSDDTGYTVGGGLEYLLSPNWSAKIEYQYYNFGHTSIAIPNPPIGGATAVRFTDDVQTIKIGVNYRFNWGSMFTGTPFAGRTY